MIFHVRNSIYDIIFSIPDVICFVRYVIHRVCYIISFIHDVMR